MMEQLGVSCGVFGAIDFKRQPVFSYIYWGLRAQNHRGHQSHGFLTYYNGTYYIHRSLDLVPKMGSSAIQEWFGRLPGHLGIGNVRYTTSGRTDEKSLVKGTQPVTASKKNIKLAISFNGNVVNTIQLRNELGTHFPRFSYECDADLICHKLLIELSETKELTSAIKNVMEEVEGAFSVAGVTSAGEFFAFKDPNGIRPLCAGCSGDHSTFAFSSETVSLDINGLSKSFEIQPGELVTVSKDGFKRRQILDNGRKAFCAFEFAYFARPDSCFNDKYVYEIREEFGRNLARENSDIVKEADIIISLPETGDDAALGVHEESGLKWERASRRHRYITERAFILLNRQRYSTIEKKINILAPRVTGKKIIVIDDSIVRGDTTKALVGRLRKMGAKKVYLFITFPRIVGPCFYGVDMATYSQLIGSKCTAEEISHTIGADCVCYQSLKGFVKSTGLSRDQLCFACATGEYPTPLAQRIADEMRRRFLDGVEETGRLYEIEEVVRSL